MKTPDALSKLLFCARIAAGPGNFFRLLYRTKQYSFSRHQAGSYPQVYDIFQVKLLQRTIPLKLRTFSGDFDMFYEIFWRKTYALPIALQEVNVLVDIGANIGMTALWWAGLFPAAQLVAVEPDPDNYDSLVANTRILRNCKTIRAAIGETDGIAGLRRSRYAYNTTVSGAGDLTAEQLSMPSLMKHYDLAAIDLLKIDIEGAEKFLFSEDTAWLKMVRYIIMEVHQGCEDVIAIVIKAGFEHRSLKGYAEGLHFFSRKD